MGSPDFSLPTLQSLASRYAVVGVVTQPDRPAGRGRGLTSPPVKALAQRLEIPIIQPPSLRQPEMYEHLVNWKPDLIVVAAYGQILRANVLSLPPHGCLNVHASLLPRWRGASPIQAAILAGDQVSGVTIMRMDIGMDTGDILCQRETPIQDSDNAETLSDRLAKIGGDLLMETLPIYLEGKITPTPQNQDAATYAPLLRKEDGELNFSHGAIELERRIRAFTPWPGAYMNWQGKILKILRARAHLDNNRANELISGARVVFQGFPAITTSDGLLILVEVQPAGKRPIPGDHFLRGARGWS